MLKFQNHSIPGELWLRDIKGDKQTASSLLSSVYLKYYSLNPVLSNRNVFEVYNRTPNLYDSFYRDLTSNQITRFDVFYDSLFIETQSGCIFEKIYLDGDQIKPFTLADSLTIKHTAKPNFLAYDSGIDYWFNEVTNKVYYTYISNLDENKNFEDRFNFVILLNEFDCETGLIQTVLFWKVQIAYTDSINWDARDCIIEDPKITFNSTSQTFNISFLLKNTIKQFGLISINVKKSDLPTLGDYAITEVNAYLPYFKTDAANCEAYPYDPNAKKPYYVVSVAGEPSDPAFNLRFLILTASSRDPYNNPVDNYLVLE